MTTPEPRTGERDERRARDADLHQRLWPEQTVEWRWMEQPWGISATEAVLVPRYSDPENWYGMRLVIARMRELGWDLVLEVHGSGRNFAVWEKGYLVNVRSHGMEGPTAPEAVCAAALACLAAREGGA